MNTTATLRQIISKVVDAKTINRKAKLKILGRTLLRPGPAVTIEQTLVQHGLGFISACHPRILEKCARPYLAATLGRGQKLAYLCAHYTALARHFSPATIKIIYTRGLPFLVGELAPYDASIRLHFDSAMEKEGELHISLDLAGRRAYSMAVVLGADTLYIGSLQGSKSAYEEIRRFTKASHGVRPHNFLAFIGRILAEHLACTRILAIDNAHHIYKSRARTVERVQFDYDTFWTETGGQQDTPPFFELPLEQPRKDLAEIATNKRAQYRRRYEFLDGCQAALLAALADIRASPSQAADRAPEWEINP